MTFRDFFRFSGRSGRTEFVLTQIAVFNALYLATFCLIIISGAGDERAAGITPDDLTGAALLTGLVVFLAGWISLAAAVRRCHDRDLSGRMLLFAFPPVLGQLWLFLCLVTGEGTPGPNRYGRRRPGSLLPSLGLSQTAAHA